MRTTRTVTLTAICLILGALSATYFVTAPSALSGADPLPGTAPPQYMTATVDANSLEAKVGDLARENWEIFSITTASSAIDQAADGKTHIIVEKFQVTARRPSAPPPPPKAKP